MPCAKLKLHSLCIFWVLSRMEVTIKLTDSYSDSCFVRLFLTHANVSEPVLSRFVQSWNLSAPASRIYFSAFFSIPSRSFLYAVASQSPPTSFLQWIGRSNRWDRCSTQAEFDSLWGLCSSHAVSGISRDVSEFYFICSRPFPSDLLFLFVFHIHPAVPFFASLSSFVFQTHYLASEWSFFSSAGHPLFHCSNFVFLMVLC